LKSFLETDFDSVVDVAEADSPELSGT